MKPNEKLVLWITGSSHFSVHAFMIILPNIMLVLKNEFGTGLDTLGLVAMLGSFMFGLGAIPTGWLETRLGSRNLLLMYYGGSILASIGIALSSTMVGFTAGLMILGLSASIYHPAGLTLISKSVRNLPGGMAAHGIAGSLGLATGPLIASFITDSFGWRGAYLVMAGFNAGLAVLTLIVVDRDVRNHHIQRESSPKNTNRRALFLYYSVAVLMGLAYAGFTTFLPAHFAQQSSGWLTGFSDTLRGGTLMTLVLTAGILGQILGGYLGNHFPRRKLVFWIVALNIPLLLALGFTSGIILLSVGLILGVVHFNFQPVGNSLIADLTQDTDRGLGYGVSFFLNFGVGALAAGLSGVIAESFGVSWVFPAMAVILLPGLFLAGRLEKAA
ncbi:MAG: MFS transporter [FCB group bacterium]|nr:MFS transporter [FCB group bacterium]